MPNFFDLRAPDLTKVARALEYGLHKTERDLQDAAQEAGYLLGQAAKARAFPVRQISIQDSNSPRRLSGRSPIRVRVVGTQGQVEAVGYWGSARAIPIRYLMQRHGHGAKLDRRFLWVNPAGKKRHPSAPVQKIRFREAPPLREWAERDDRRQFQRHAVRIPPEVREDLILDPALDQERDRILRRFARALEQFA